jgi:hypothetical protein
VTVRRLHRRPIPGNPALGGLHVQLPGEGNEPSSIFDFEGFVGIADIVGRERRRTQAVPSGGCSSPLTTAS